MSNKMYREIGQSYANDVKIELQFRNLLLYIAGLNILSYLFIYFICFNLVEKTVAAWMIVIIGLCICILNVVMAYSIMIYFKVRIAHLLKYRDIALRVADGKPIDNQE